MVTTASAMSSDTVVPISCACASASDIQVRRSQVSGHVLKRASRDVESAVERNIDDAIAVMPLLIDDGLNAAMKQLHTKDKQSGN